MQANRGELQIAGAPCQPITLQQPPPSGTPYQLPDEQEALGPLGLPPGLMQLLADAAGKPQLADFESARAALLASRGRLLGEVVEALSGKAAPKVSNGLCVHVEQAPAQHTP